ncbi:MAG: uroporphyrinogen-III C-methyltransferase [Pirellulales bacterium]
MPDDTADRRPCDDQGQPAGCSGRAGCVYLIGAGPGDPGLITWRGVQLLRQADLVLYDYLANPELLDHAAVHAERICLGQHGRIAQQGRIAQWSPEQIHQRMIDGARSGALVVRLKGGDASIFGRLADELAALRQAGVAYEVVPGLTAALAAPAYAGIPLTDRSSASAVALITAQQQPLADGSASLDYDALARFPGTLVFYMGVTEVGTWSGKLLQAGKPADTPVAMIRHCSLPRQEVAVCRLDEVAEQVRLRRLRPPVLFVCGDVVHSRDELGWFEQRSLFGRRVLVTRPGHQRSALGDLLQQRGAEVWYWGAIEIGPPDDWGPVDRALDQLDSYAWVVFSSANGVTRFLDRCWDRGGDARRLNGVRIAAIGPGTARSLEGYRLRADLVPDEYQAEGLAAALAPHVAGRRVLLVRASRGREVLAESLRAAGAEVDQVVAYSSRDSSVVDPRIAQAIASGTCDWVTVTSSAIARSLVQQFGADLKRCRLVSISSITSATLRELGADVAAEAREATMEGVVTAMEQAEAESARRPDTSESPS